MIVLALVHLKNGRDDSRGTVTTFLFMQMVHGIVLLWFVLVFPSDTVISMRLPNSEQIKDSIGFLCLRSLQHMKLDHPLIGMVM